MRYDDNDSHGGGKLPGIAVKWIAIGLALTLGIVGLTWAWTNFISVRNAGETWQNTLNAQYSITQIELGNCIDQSRQASGVATALTDAQVRILEAAVTGRYVDDDGNSTAATDATQGGAWFSAVVEAYPDLNPTGEAFQDVMIIVTSCRGAYNGEQKKLQGIVQSFENWKDVRGIWNWAGKARFPTDGLQAMAAGYGSEIIYGDPALERMKRIIVVEDVGQAYQEGLMPDQDLFGDK